MKTLKLKSLGVEVSKEVPSTLEELKAIGLDQQAVIDTAVKHICYHVFLGEVRDRVQAIIEQPMEKGGRFGLERPFTFLTNKKGEETEAKSYSETVEKWIDGLVSRKEVTESEKAEVVQQAVREVKFEAAKPRAGKVDKDLEERTQMAEAMMKDSERLGKFEKKLAVAELEVPEEGWSVETLAEAIKAFRLAI